MKRVLLATEKPFADNAVEKISSVFKQAGYKFDILAKYQSKAEFLEASRDVDGIIVRSDILDKEVLDAAQKLRITVRAGAGYDNVDTTYARERNVVVMNTPGQNSNAVAELAIGLAILGAREFFSGKTGVELRGRTLGLHGYGYVARNVNRIARGLGMSVKVYTRYSKSQAVSEGLVVTDSLEQLYAESDIISIHVPARGEHIRSVGFEILKHMKQGSILVNTARKEVINETDLCRFMEDRTDVKYLSDIVPDCVEIFKEKFGGRYFFTTKKAGAQTEEANTNAGIAAAEQIVAFFENGDETFRVNK